MYIIYGWGDVVRKGTPLGITACDHCYGMNMHYLARVVFRVHICYIPVFCRTKKYYIMCENCKEGIELTKEAYNNLKAAHKDFRKKKVLIECYQFIEYLITNLDYSDINVQNVLNQVMARYPINNEILVNQYRSLIATMLQNKPAVITNN